MKNYSTTFIGIGLTVALPLLVKVGFSESCGSEIINWLFVSAVPGLITIWKTRINRGDVTVAGFRK